MATTYTWKVTNLRKLDELEGNTDVLVHVRWVKTGTDDDGITGEFNGATPLRLPEPSGSGDFTAFEDITEETVLGWIQNEIQDRSGYESHINEQIAKQISAKKNPVREVSILPWGVQAVGISPAAPAATYPSSSVSASAPPRYVESIGL